MIEFELPIKTVNPTNNRQHWRTVWRRSKKERLTASKGAWAYRISGGIDLPAIVTITRISAGTLDDDNLRPALKSIRDGVADAFSVADNDKRIEWRYQQERCAPKRYGVRIRIETKGEETA